MKGKGSTKEELIFDATLSLVAQLGLAGVSMEAVAKQAKIATGTVYIYFKSKEELLNKLYVNVKLQFSGTISEGFSADKPFKVLFKKMCNDYLDYFLEHYPETIFMQQFYNSPYVTETAVDATKDLLQPLYKLLERGKTEMLLKDMDTRFMIFFLHGTIGHLAGFIRAQPVRKTYTDQVWTICWDALKL
jgi:AcrR family transcriptional regulator